MFRSFYANYRGLALDSLATIIMSAKDTPQISWNESRWNSSLAYGELQPLNLHTGKTNRQRIWDMQKRPTELHTNDCWLESSLTSRCQSDQDSSITTRPRNPITWYRSSKEREWNYIRVAESDYGSEHVMETQRTFVLKVATILARAACCPI